MRQTGHCCLDKALTRKRVSLMRTWRTPADDESILDKLRARQKLFQFHVDICNNLAVKKRRMFVFSRYSFESGSVFDNGILGLEIIGLSQSSVALLLKLFGYGRDDCDFQIGLGL